MKSWTESGPGLDLDQTDIDGPRWSQSQIFHQGLDCLVSGLAKMAQDRTKLNFPNTNAEGEHDGGLQQ